MRIFVKLCEIAGDKAKKTDDIRVSFFCPFLPRTLTHYFPVFSSVFDFFTAVNGEVNEENGTKKKCRKAYQRKAGNDK